MQIIRNRCAILIRELGDGKTILYNWGEVWRDISQGNSEDEETEAKSTDKPLLAELAYKEVDGVWAARAQLEFAYSKLSYHIYLLGYVCH